MRTFSQVRAGELFGFDGKNFLKISPTEAVNLDPGSSDELQQVDFDADQQVSEPTVKFI